MAAIPTFLAGDSIWGVYVGKASVTAFRRRCSDPSVSGPGGVMRDTAVVRGFASFFQAVDPRAGFRCCGPCFLATFPLPPESGGFTS